MKAYAIVCRPAQSSEYGLVEPNEIYLSMASARERAVEMMLEKYKTFSQEFNIDENGVETIRYMLRGDFEVCRILTLEVK